MELYLNGHRIELSGNTIAQTIQVNDLAELKDRQLSFTNRIKAPMTPKNISNLSMLGLVGSTSIVHKQKISARLVEDGIVIVENGSVRFKGIVGNDYEFVIYSGNIDLYDTLEGKKINEIDFTSLNHELNFQSFLDSLNNTEGFIHPIADFGKSLSDPSHNHIIDYNTGVIFVHTIWDMIFNESGLSYTGDFFSNEEFLKKVIAPIRGHEGTISLSNQTSLGNVNGTGISGQTTLVTGQVYSISQFFSLSGSGTNFTVSGDTITINFTGIIVLNIQSTTYVSPGYPSSSYLYEFFLNGQSFASIMPSGNQDRQLVFFVNSGDTFKAKINAEYIGQQSHDYYEYSFDLSISILETETTGPIIDYSVLFSDTKQTDFIKDIMQRFGLIFRPTLNDGEFEFVEMEEILKNGDEAEDWSHKFIKQIGSSPVGQYAQKNIFKNKYEDDVNAFADGELIIQNENLEDEKDMFTSVFTASRSYVKWDGIDIYKLYLFESDDDQNIIPRDDEFRIFDIEHHSVGMKSVLVLFNEPYQHSGDVPFLDFSGCDYSVHVTNSYNKLKETIENGFKRTLLLNLNILDIYFINLFKLKYFDQIGEYMYLNKVINYQSGKKTKVELVTAFVGAIGSGNIPGETYKILKEDEEALLTESGNNLIKE